MRKWSLQLGCLLLLGACNETIIKGGNGDRGVDPAYCGDMPISYASVNAQIFIKNCTVNGCHGGAAPIDLSTHESVRGNLPGIKTAVLANRMPPMGPLSATDKMLLLAWINQGAPLRSEDADLACGNEIEGDTDQPEPLLQPTYESLRANVFTQNCLGCHRAGSRIGDFASYEAITSEANRDLFSAPLPENTEFVARLTTQDATKVMPPPRTGLARLSPEVIEVINAWIANGQPKE